MLNFLRIAHVLAQSFRYKIIEFPLIPLRLLYKWGKIR